MTPGDRPLSHAERERTIEDHIAAENRHDAAAAIATFARPRYEVVGTGEVHEGAEEVAAMYAELFAAVPDVTVTALSVDHQDSSSIVRFEMTGTDLGGYRGAAPTGRAIRIEGISQFVFSDDGLVCERVYSVDQGPDPDGHLTRLGNTVSLSAVRRARRHPRP